MWKRKVSCTSWLAKSTFYEVRSEVMERNKCLKELKSFNENAVTWYEWKYISCITNECSYLCLVIFLKDNYCILSSLTAMKDIYWSHSKLTLINCLHLPFLCLWWLSEPPAVGWAAPTYSCPFFFFCLSLSCKKCRRDTITIETRSACCYGEMPVCHDGSV